jgi:hypothetical protein
MTDIILTVLKRTVWSRGTSSVQISAGTPVTLGDVFRDSSQSLQANYGTVPRLGHDSFLPNNS